MKNNYFFKRILSVVVMLMASSFMWAYDFVVDGICYNVNEDGESVEVAQYDDWDNLYSGDIVIPSSVAYEGKNYSVTSIGNYAFYGCSALTSVEIPNSVTSIEELAFGYCSSLASIEIPNSVTSIRVSAFNGCSSLVSIEIPNSVTSIGNSAFAWCISLASIIVADDNPVYDSREGCNAIIETASNTLIAGCQNTVIPNSVTSIGVNAFSGCSSLTSIEIPNSVTSIGNGAFVDCSSLASIEIPSSVTSIRGYAFSDCSSLTSIIVADDNPIYDSREGCNAIIEKESNKLIAGCQNTVIPNSVTSIGDYAFYGCSSLTSVEIHNNVTNIGDYAFYGCSSLTSVEIPNSVTSIGYGAFYRCSSLTSIEIPNSVTSIENFTFASCSSLISVEFPNSVTSIGLAAFQLCSSLTSVICYADEVPYLASSVFNLVPQNEATLYVPALALEAYKAADQWKDFGTILPIDEDTNGITSTTAEQEADATYYTLDGVSVKNPTKKGIYIKNGKKVFINK